MRTSFATLLLLALSTPLRAQELPNPGSSPPVPTIVTTGEAIVRRAPDQAYVTAAVETRARTPREAQQQNAASMTAMIQKATSSGIPKDAVRTLGYTVQQDVDLVNGRRVPRDFVARNAVEVRVDAIENAGEVLDALVQGGATSVERIRFDVKDRAMLEREALRLAVGDARARADAAAGGAGVTVVRVLRIDDTRQPEYRGPMAMAATRGAMADAVTTPIEPATIEIRATVTITVAIK